MQIFNRNKKKGKEKVKRSLIRMVKGEKRMGTSQKMTYETGYRFHIIIKSLVSKGNMHDSKISQQIMDSLKKFYLMLANVAYDPLTIYN